MHREHERRPLVVDLVDAVADHRDVDPRDMRPLAGYLDPQALTRLLQTATCPVTVSLELYGCIVDVDEEGNVSVSGNGPPTNRGDVG